MKKKISEHIAEELDIEKDIIMNIPRLSIVGNREIYIENYRHITEYTSECIAVKTNDYILKIEGAELNLRYITKEDLKITGIFAQIIFTH